MSIKEIILRDELKILPIANILNNELALPLYQRPYRWSIKSTNMLFNDIRNAYMNDPNKEYRIGTIIFYKDSRNNKYYIIDGQQRLTTLTILLYCLDDKKAKEIPLMKAEYCKESQKTILTNYKLLKKRVNELGEEKQGYMKYVYDNCTAAQIVTTEAQLAFQFFDSQNSRGKELAPHDLLKSYHLREMEDVDEREKTITINKWENLNQDSLEKLFKFYLYPITQWHKGKAGLGYASDKIDTFKGLRSDNKYNYSIYHRASNLYIEQFNASGNTELVGGDLLNQFQLTQPIIAGSRFFYYILHYEKLLKLIRTMKVITNFELQGLLPDRGSGDRYIKQLFECSLLFYADKFGLNRLTETKIRILHTWCYSLRLVMHSVYQQTVNSYARGQHEKIKNGNIFSIISDMVDPDELDLIDFLELSLQDDNYKSNKRKILEKHTKNYKSICDALGLWHGWQIYE